MPMIRSGTWRWCPVAGLVLWAVLIGATGCALTQTGDDEVSAAFEGYRQQHTRQAELYGAVSEVAPPTQDGVAAAPQPQPRTLAGLIVVALEHNPDILAAGETARSKAARIPQVTVLPDPMLSMKILPEPIRTAEGDNYFVLGFRQTLVIPEKLDRRGRIALEQTRQAIEELRLTRLRVIGQVKRSYFKLYVVDKTIQAIQENRDLLRGLIDVARGQLVAGRRLQQDVLRAQVELSNLDSQLIELRQRRTTVEAMINRLLSRPLSSAVATPSAIDIRRIDLAVARLVEHAGRTNPQLAGLRHAIERDRQAVELARLAYWPELTVGFEWITMAPRTAFKPPINPQTRQRPPAPMLSEEASDNWAITASVNLPIWWDKIEGGIREARRRLAAMEQRYVSMQDTVAYQIEEALTRVKAQRELADVFASTIIPQAKQAYEVSLAGYSAGTNDFQATIDNWQKWLMFTIQYHRAIGELERAVADLEEAVGLSLVDAAGGETEPETETGEGLTAAEQTGAVSGDR